MIESSVINRLAGKFKQHEFYGIGLFYSNTSTVRQL